MIKQLIARSRAAFQRSGMAHDPTNSGAVDRYARGIPTRFEQLATHVSQIARSVELLAVAMVDLQDNSDNRAPFWRAAEQLSEAGAALRSLVEEHRADLEREYRRRRALNPGADDPRRRSGAAYLVPVKDTAAILLSRTRVFTTGAYAFVVAAAVTFAFTRSALAFALELVCAIALEIRAHKLARRALIAATEELTDAIAAEEHDQ